MNTSNLIIILLLAVILFFAVRGTITHLKGEGECCGGPKEKPIKKKMSGTPQKKLVLSVEGMSCDHCRVRVENALNAMDGVLAKVNLSKQQAKVSLYKEMDEEQLKEAVTKAGYEVTKIATV